MNLSPIDGHWLFGWTRSAGAAGVARRGVGPRHGAGHDGRRPQVGGAPERRLLSRGLRLLGTRLALRPRGGLPLHPALAPRSLPRRGHRLRDRSRATSTTPPPCPRRRHRAGDTSPRTSPTAATRFVNLTLGFDGRFDSAVGLGPFVIGIADRYSPARRDADRHGRRNEVVQTGALAPVTPWLARARARRVCAAPSTRERATRLRVTPRLTEATLREPLRRALAAAAGAQAPAGRGDRGGGARPPLRARRRGARLARAPPRDDAQPRRPGRVPGRQERRGRRVAPRHGAARDATRSSASRARASTSSARSTTSHHHGLHHLAVGRLARARRRGRAQPERGRARLRGAAARVPRASRGRAALARLDGRRRARVGSDGRDRARLRRHPARRS